MQPSLSREAFAMLVVLTGMVGCAVRFHGKQNRKEGAWTGGEISWPKAFWLFYAIGAWFLLPWIFFLSPAVAAPLKWVLGFHLAVWWIRGPLELVMIYRWFNWSPIYGISHDVLHLLMLFAGTAWALGTVGWSGVMSSAGNFHAFVLLCTTCFALNAEAVFAALFIATRGKGAEKIYFASTDPIYQLINRFTFAVCVVVYAVLGLQTMALFAGVPA